MNRLQHSGALMTLRLRTSNKTGGELEPSGLGQCGKRGGWQGTIQRLYCGGKSDKWWSGQWADTVDS
jgi:hypothetical protein